MDDGGFWEVEQEQEVDGEGDGEGEEEEQQEEQEPFYIGDANELTIPKRYLYPEIRKIKLLGCMSYVIEFYCRQSSKLESIKALCLPNDSLEVADIAEQENLKHLEIQFVELGNLMPNLNALSECSYLACLRLKHVNSIKASDIRALTSLKFLKELELSYCHAINRRFALSVFRKFRALESLRLQTSWEVANFADHICEAVKGSVALQSLELINFVLKNRFIRQLGHCYSIKRLLLCPRFVGSGLVTFKLVLKALGQAPPNLKAVTWVLDSQFTYKCKDCYPYLTINLEALKRDAELKLAKMKVNFVELPESLISNAKFIE